MGSKTDGMGVGRPICRTIVEKGGAKSGGITEKGAYSRSLTAAELAAVTAGDRDEKIVALGQDEADRDAFFAALGTKAQQTTKDCPPPEASAKGDP